MNKFTFNIDEENIKKLTELTIEAVKQNKTTSYSKGATIRLLITNAYDRLMSARLVEKANETKI